MQLIATTKQLEPHRLHDSDGVVRQKAGNRKLPGNWLFAARELDLLEKSALSLRFGNTEVGLFVVGKQYFAIENTCPHAAAWSLLTDGHVRGEFVECPYHNARFHIPTGRCVRQPGRDLVRYQLKVDNGDIYINI